MQLAPFSLLKLSSQVIVLSFILIGITLLLWFFSSSPYTALSAFYLGPLASPVSWGNFLNQACLVTLTGLGARFAFSVGALNLGGEGQTYLGAFFCTACGLLWPPFWEGFLGMIFALTAGSVAGALLGGASGIAKMRWNANEMITTYLVSLSLFPLIDALLSLPLLKDQHSQLISSKTISHHLWFLGVLSPSNFHIGVLIVVPMITLLTFFFFQTPCGFSLKLIGCNHRFAHYIGIPEGLFSFFPLTVSGFLHGLAGSLAVLGSQHALVQGMTQGWGWSGIIATLLVRGHPLGIFPAALFLSYLDHACQNVVLQGQFSYQLGALLQALILLFLTAQVAIFRSKERNLS